MSLKKKINKNSGAFWGKQIKVFIVTVCLSQEVIGCGPHGILGAAEEHYA